MKAQISRSVFYLLRVVMCPRHGLGPSSAGATVPRSVICDGVLTTVIGELLIFQETKDQINIVLVSRKSNKADGSVVTNGGQKVCGRRGNFFL